MKYTVFPEGQLQTNCTVLERDGKCIVVDLPFGATKLTNYVIKHKLQLQGVLLTHGHFDHCGGVFPFLQQYGQDVPIFCHSADWELCKTAKENYWRVPCENCYPTNAVVEEKLQVGDFVFDVLETPGHTAGSVVYLIDNLMLGGDLVFHRSIGRTDFPESNRYDMVQSLRKVGQLQRDYQIICGHGQQTSLQFEKLHNAYMRDALKLQL